MRMKNSDVTFPLERSEVISMLQQFKISPTRQRVEIAEFLFQRPQHLSAEKILDGVIDAGNRVSRATVYNTMGLFSSKGVVREVLIDRERVFYDSNTEMHHHLYNIDTGELTDVYDAKVEMVSEPELAEGLRVVETDVVFKVTSN
jgi:Fur family iron response transcriptional regulator